MVAPATLDEPASLEPSAVGVKAARLAAARVRGFPVLPGVIVPAVTAEPALSAGRAAVATGRPAAARAAVRAAGVAPGLARDIERAVGGLGTRLVVRSSTRLDDDATWAGAFASFGDIAPREVVTAVQGCWASAFSPDVLDRLFETGRPLSDVGVAVLVQPQIEPLLSGSSRMSERGVEVTFVSGAPAALLNGWAGGDRVVVGGDGSIVAAGRLPGAQTDAVRRVAAIARDASADLGADRLEWALAETGVVILQLGADEQPKPAEVQRRAGVTDLPAYRRLATMLLERRGPFAERVVAPWAAAAPEGLRAAASTGTPRELMDLAATLAAELIATVAGAVGSTAAELADRVAQVDPELGRRLELVEVDRGAAERLLGACAGFADALVRAGRLRTEVELWWQTPEWVAQAVAGGGRPPARRPGFDRFTEALVAVAAGTGGGITGAPSSPGLAVGRAVSVESPADRERLMPGDMLVVDAALPVFAPLLWTAAGLIARRGSPAAHLCEVARALRKPAVVSVDVGDLVGPDRWALAVDGATGEVWKAQL